MKLRPSKTLKKIREGKTAFATKLNICSPRIAEIAAMAGLDCLWIDMEHVPSDYADIENIIRAAKIYDCDVLTRISRTGGYSDIIRPLEADSTGIMIPHIMNAEDARKMVYYTKFHPTGRRPLDGGNADGRYGAVNSLDYIKEANEERFTVIQIEDPEPLDELEEICSLPGIDMIFFGAADFSQGIGKPCMFDDEEIEKTRKFVAKTARKHGKIAGAVGSFSSVKTLEDEGYNFISLGADVVGLWDYYRSITDFIEKN